MSNENLPLKKKRIWRSPEIHNVGKIGDLTDVGVDNVRDNTNDQLPTYRKGASIDPNAEVELKD